MMHYGIVRFFGSQLGYSLKVASTVNINSDVDEGYIVENEDRFN
jgi:hypothetical protein